MDGPFSYNWKQRWDLSATIGSKDDLPKSWVWINEIGRACVLGDFSTFYARPCKIFKIAPTYFNNYMPLSNMCPSQTAADPRFLLEWDGAYMILKSQNQSD